MVKLKLDDDDFDVESLDVEYEEMDFPQYDGEQPPAGTILTGRIEKAWWSYSSNDNSMIKVIFVADENPDPEDQFNGLPIWDNLVFVSSAAFRYKPFLEAMGITLRDVKSKTYIEEDDTMGAPITKIADWEPNGDFAWCRVLTKRERYKGEWQTKVQKYLPYDEGDEPDDEPEDEPEDEEAPPPRSRARKPATAAPKARAGTSRRKPAPEPDEDDPDDPDEEDDPPARPTRSRRSAPSGRTSARAKPAARSTKASARSKPAARGRGRGRAAAADDDPPF